MAERKQIPIFESCYKITEYLKKNTDKDHPTTQAAMRKDETVSQYLGAKETSNSYINQIALALNSDNGELLKEKDLDAYNKIHPNNRKRVERALELVELNQDINDKNEKVKYYDALIIFLNMDRDLLYTRINNRVDKMVELGLLDEFENVYPDKLGVQASRAIGIQELIEYKLGNNTLDEAISLIKQHSRNYAKRQITWFKHKSDCVMIDKNENSIEDIINLIEKFLNN